VTHSADMQFVGQTHLINVPLPSSHGRRERRCRRLFEKAYFARFKVELPEIRANLVNLNTSVTGVRPDIDLSSLIDPAGRMATLGRRRREVRPVWFAGRWHDTAVYIGKRCRSTPSSKGRQSLSRWTPPPCSNPATGRARTSDGNIIIDIGEAWETAEMTMIRIDPSRFRSSRPRCSRFATRWI
jgi:N-methylhydantoinase A